jgi:DNA-binding response OmpR family regulator
LRKPQSIARSAKRPGVAAQSGRSEGKTGPVRARLLLVEDHGPTRASLQRLLTARNFEVGAAGCVAEAWNLAADTGFDLLLSDIGLPDGDGYLLMRELQDRYGMRGIALTGFGLDDDIKLSKEAGFSLHLVKPIRARDLDEALASLGV